MGWGRVGGWGRVVGVGVIRVCRLGCRVLGRFGVRWVGVGFGYDGGRCCGMDGVGWLGWV